MTMNPLQDPDTARAPAVASSDLLACAAALCEIVEGVNAPIQPWRSKSMAGMRLKDTPEWARFYVALKLSEREAQTVNDPRMWREQCRVGDVAFQHLFCVSNGKPLPDWVTEGLPRMYQLLGEHARYREALQRIATSHPINDEPLATAHSLRAHKALRPDCKCGRCAPNDGGQP